MIKEFVDIVDMVLPAISVIVAGYAGYLNGRIRQLERDMKRVEVQTALNTKDGQTFEKYLDEFKTDIKKEMQEIKDILNRNIGSQK